MVGCCVGVLLVATFDIQVYKGLGVRSGRHTVYRKRGGVYKEGIQVHPREHTPEGLTRESGISIDQSIQDPPGATHGQGEAVPSIATGGSKPLVTK